MLKQYLKEIGKKEAKKLAEQCGTTLGYLLQVAGGHRKAGESLAIELEKATNKRVLCEQLRPDVDWSYLRNSAA